MKRVTKLCTISGCMIMFVQNPSMADDSFVKSLDYGISLNHSVTEQELQFVNPQNGDSSIVDLSTNTNGLQISVSSDNWSFSAATQDTSDSDNSTTDELQQTVRLNQTGNEFSLGYYHGDWSYHLTYGSSDYGVTQNNLQARPSLEQDFISHQTLNQTSYQDTFWQLSASKWVELTNINENLAATVEVSASYYDSSGSITRLTHVRQNSNSPQAKRFVQIIEERTGNPLQLGIQSSPRVDTNNSQWIYNISGSLDYAQTWWQKDGFISTWLSVETSDSEDGTITLSRPGRGPNGINRSITLDQSIESDDDVIISSGVDMTVNLTSNWSLTLGFSDSNVSNALYNVNLYYGF